MYGEARRAVEDLERRLMHLDDETTAASRDDGGAAVPGTTEPPD